MYNSTGAAVLRWQRMKDRRPQLPAPIYQDRADLEHTTRGILPTDFGSGETVLRQLEATYEDGQPRSREQATVDLNEHLRQTMQLMPGFALIADPEVALNKRGRWTMTVRLKPMNRWARRHVEKMRERNNVKNLS